MSLNPKTKAPFGVLDALSIAHLPDDHLVAAVASYLLANGHGLPMAVEAAHSAAELLARTEDQVDAVAGRITDAIRHQMIIKVDRIGRRLWNLKHRRMGAELDWVTRINRLCRSVYGLPETWQHAKKVEPKVRDSHFNWFKRIDGVMVAGFEGYGRGRGGFLTGFVYIDGGPTKYCLLPSRTHSPQELMSLLGLHPRLVDGDVRVDWDRQSFLIGKANRLPWVVP